MNILYFDLNAPDLLEPWFNYDNYGGGCVFFRAAFPKIDISLAAREEAFKGYTGPEGRKIILFEEQIQRIRRGEPIKDILDLRLLSSFDLIVHNFSNIWINTEGTRCRSCHWNVGYGEFVHPNNKHVLLFDKENQAARFSSPNHIIYDVVIGPKASEFQEYLKEDLIFNCGRITPSYRSIEVAQLAIRHEIPMIFCGPKDRDYPFERYIDNEFVQYLGVVSQETKDKYNKLAKLSCQMMNYPISVTLSMKEAAAKGVACMASPVGQYNSWIKDGINGFLIRSEQDFLNAWEKRDSIRQFDCYQSMLPLSEDYMIDSFMNAFYKIIHDQV